MVAIYSNGGNRWNILGFNFTKLHCKIDNFAMATSDWSSGNCSEIA